MLAVGEGRGGGGEVISDKNSELNDNKRDFRLPPRCK
jgi:hypothetical protein